MYYIITVLIVNKDIQLHDILIIILLQLHGILIIILFLY
jgi:hypothetical protein